MTDPKQVAAEWPEVAIRDGDALLRRQPEWTSAHIAVGDIEDVPPSLLSSTTFERLFTRAEVEAIVHRFRTEDAAGYNALLDRTGRFIEEREELLKRAEDAAVTMAHWGLSVSPCDIDEDVCRERFRELMRVK